MSSFKKGGMFILSSPSGAGKTTLVKKISKNKKFFVSISHTTRLPRPNEKNGKDYFFVSKNNIGAQSAVNTPRAKLSLVVTIASAFTLISSPSFSIIFTLLL